MPWPTSSRYQQLIPNVTVLTAALGHAIQDALIALYGTTGVSGTQICVEADGTGAQAKTAAPGEVLGNALASSTSKRSTSLPNTSTTLARTYKEGHLLANGTFDIDGGGNLVIVEGEGFKSAVGGLGAASTGVYTIVTNLTPAHPAEAKVQITMMNATTNLSPSFVASATGGGEVQVVIRVLDATDTLSDCGFCLSVWGA